MTSKNCSELTRENPLDTLALDQQVCFALYAANRAVTARYRPLLAELGVTYPQYLVLLVLWESEQNGEPARVSNLGERLRLDSGTLTPLLKRLQEHGLVNRERSANDERVVVITLTTAGRALRTKAQSIPGRLLCDSGLSPARVTALRDELKALLSRLDQADPTSVQSPG